MTKREKIYIMKIKVKRTLRYVRLLHDKYKMEKNWLNPEMYRNFSKLLVANATYRRLQMKDTSIPTIKSVMDDLYRKGTSNISSN